MFRRAEDFLWAVRCHMHFVTGRAEERLSFDIQREIAVRLGYTAHPGMKDVERFMKHYFLVAKDVGDLTAILSSALEEREAKPMPVLDRVVARFRPRPRRVVLESDDFVADHNRINIADAGRVPARSGQPHPHLPPGAEAQSRVPSGRDARRDALAQADRPDAARGQDREPAVLRDPHLGRRRGRAAPHERGGRARPLRARLRAHRRDDAVQHVPPLHGGRAPAALHRHPGRHRGGRQRRVRARQRADEDDPEAASRAALCGAVPARHRQGPHRGSFDRRRAHRAALLPAARPLAGRDRHGGLAGRAAPGDVERSRSRATCPTARRSRISPPWCSRSSG